jgi:hypothetical protein
MTWRIRDLPTTFASMCTLVIGRNVLAPRSLWIAANRDEDLGRPSDPPALLLDHPRVAGGRDGVARGTWLAVRERRAVVAMLNRRPIPEGTSGSTADGATPTGSSTPPALRSRGLLALETAAATESGSDFAGAAIDFVHRSLLNARYAPFSMVIATPDEAWVLSLDPPAPLRTTAIETGWHVITHADLDDPNEPRTASLLADLRSWRPTTDFEIERGLIERLGRHDPPAVCIHEGRMVTVSSALVHLTPRTARYLHAEGRPCESVFEDRSFLLDPAHTKEPA